MKILFACGGTGGPNNPAIAIANTVKTHRPDTEILFAGNPNGMESKLVPGAGYNFVPIEIKGFMRKPTWFNIKYNVSSVGLLMKSARRAKQILDDFQPDVVVGTGGYVSYPILKKAAELGYKTLAHESNAFPGLATKLVSKTVDKVLLAVEEAHTHLDDSVRWTVTGNPVREEMLFTDRKKAREALGIGDRVCILTFGGSQGARRINECVADLMAWHNGGEEVHHIHATGSYGTELFPSLLKERGVDIEGNPHIDVREYIDNMPQCLTAADLVISRSGAMTLCEIQAVGRASILIPSPNVANNHQYYNAKVLEDHGAAILIKESDLTGDLLVDKVKALTATPAKLDELGKNAQKMAILDANQRIYEEILAVLSR